MDSLLLEQLIADGDATTAGNYFVSNYPPYSFWKPEFSARVRPILEEPAPAGTPLGIYLHVPFCRKRCHFCYFRVYTDKNAQEIGGYLDATLHELALYARTPRIAGRLPKFVYFGGGTPSYLSVAQLTSLTDRMKSLLPWSEAEEITFECEPGTLKEEKLAALREIGITRLSLGVENFDARILEVNGRAHRAEEIYRAYRYAREVGFPQINIDLIAGMVDETEENWQRNIRETLSLAPDSVTIYQMEVPYNTTIFKEMKETGKLSAPVADWATKRRWVSEAFAAFEEAGYTVTSAYTAVRNPEQTRFIYRDRLWTGADLVGLGVASFSHVGGVHFQNLTEFGQYLEAVENSQFPIHRAFETDAEERMIRELILQLKLGRVSQSYFLNKFGISLSEKFGEQIAFLKSRGLMNELADGSGDWLTLDRQALLKVDVIVHAFFLPRHRSPRYT